MGKLDGNREAPTVSLGTLATCWIRGIPFSARPASRRGKESAERADEQCRSRAHMPSYARLRRCACVISWWRTVIRRPSAEYQGSSICGTCVLLPCGNWGIYCNWPLVLDRRTTLAVVANLGTVDIYGTTTVTAPGFPRSGPPAVSWRCRAISVRAPRHTCPWPRG